ncbi:response regulator [Pseudohoeflea suaedae]|uniref:Response regulator n=1 Tax=Pseudohoeflea suaedae TaxID=877384 RepID=A0A4R5PM42_9HYPH|nr:response regulator [Pseudohoeflea suaedae]TDH38016.1 response regulator [Pseudohoeflea suaedae]
MTHVSKTILIVEDDPFIALDAADTIENLGMDCIIAHDCKSALRYIESMSLDAALLDFNLGRESSVAIAKRLEAAGLPYCFISGHDPRQIRAESGLEPAIFTKPANYADIAHKVLQGSA